MTALDMLLHVFLCAFSSRDTVYILILVYLYQGLSGESTLPYALYPGHHSHITQVERLLANGTTSVQYCYEEVGYHPLRGVYGDRCMERNERDASWHCKCHRHCFFMTFIVKWRLEIGNSNIVLYSVVLLCT